MLLLFLVKTRFVKVLVSYFVFTFLIRDVKLKENGQAVGCTRLLVGLLGSFSQPVHRLCSGHFPLNELCPQQASKENTEPGPGNRHLDYLEKNF